MIPRTLHQFWTNFDPPHDPPRDVAKVMEVTRRRFQGWEYHLWNSETVEDLLDSMPEYLEIFRRVKIPAMKSDLARILVLHEFGGMYLDASSYPRYEDSAQQFLGETDPSIVVAESFENSEVLMNRIVACEAGHACFRSILETSFQAVADSIESGQESIDVWGLTGITPSNELASRSETIPGLRRLTIEEVLTWFMRESCDYKNTPLGNWNVLQTGNYFPVYDRATESIRS